MKINHLEYAALPEYSFIFGHELNDEDMIHLLSGISCQKSMVILSRFSSLHIAICQQNHDAICLDCQLRMVHSKHIQKTGGKWFDYNRYKTLMCPQSIFELEKWALLYCPIENNLSPIMLPDLMLVMDALLAVNDRLPKDEVEGHEAEYLYLMLYHNTHKNIKDQIARAFYIFSILAKKTPQMEKFLMGYERQRGFTLEDRLTVLFNSLANVIPQFTIEDMFINKPYVDAENFDAKGLAPVYDKIIQTVRTEYDVAQSNARRTINQTWNFEPFYRYPFVKIGDLQFAFSEATIVYQMWEGSYWDVRYTFKDDGEEFMTLFGQPFEQYVQEITEASVDNSKGKAKFLNEFMYKYKGESRASTDCYFRIGNTLIAVEAKAKSPRSCTLTRLNRKAVNEEVKELMFCPTKQVSKRLKEICSDDNDIVGSTAEFFSGVERTIVLAVCMEKVQPIGELLFEFDDLLVPEIDGTTIVAYHCINIEEFESICNLIELCPDELPELFVNWFLDQRKDIRSAVVLANYLSSCGKPNRCSRYISKRFSESMKEISLRTFGEDITLKLDLK